MRRTEGSELHTVAGFTRVRHTPETFFCRAGTTMTGQVARFTTALVVLPSARS